MSVGSAYLAAALAVLAILLAVLVLVPRARRGPARLTPLGGLAFAFVVAGIVFGESRLLGYGLLAVGVALAVADIVRRYRKA